MENGSIRSAAAILVCVLMGGVASTDASAQGLDSPYRFVDRGQYIGVFGAYLGTGDGAVGLGPSASASGGARYGLRVSGPFTLEGQLGFFPSTRAVLDTVPGDTTVQAVGEADFSLLLFQAGLRFNITGPRTYHSVQPFLLFGAGVAIDLAGEAPAEEPLAADARFDFGTSFAGEFGAGIEWFLSPGLGLRLDARNLLWRLETPAAFLQGERGLVLPDREWTQNLFVSAGLSIHF